MAASSTNTRVRLIAVKLCDAGRGVWVLKDGEFKKLCDVPKECTSGRICVVSDDIIVVGFRGTWSFSLSTKEWKRLKGMPANWRDPSAVAIDDVRMMMLGGKVSRIGEGSNVCDIFHAKLNEWSTAAHLPKSLERPLVAFLAGKIYIVPQDLFGLSKTQFHVYDPPSNTYSRKANLPSYIHKTRGSCLMGVKDTLYLLGGADRLTWQYSPHTDLWSPLAKTTAEYNQSEGCCAVVGEHNKILLCGGINSTWWSSKTNKIEEYNIETRQWEALDFCLPFDYHQDNSSVMWASMNESLL